MTPRLRADLDAIPGYVPGASAPGLIKLASNEMPFPPLDAVVAAISSASATVPRYPDAGATALVRRLADKHQVAQENITVGCGSVDLTQQLVQATSTASDEVVYPWRSFEAYPIQVRVVGASSVQVPLTDEHIDLDAVAAAITDRTRLVLICSPNNPTGTAITGADIERFLERVPADVLVVLDEAYREFVDDPDAFDGMDHWRSRDNVVVLRTMSKAYGLAGLRVGYAIGPAPVIAALRKVALPFDVNTLAQAAAVAALDCEDEVRDRCAVIVRSRTTLRDALLAQGFSPPPTQGNFVWLPLRDKAAEFAAHTRKNGVLVRPFDHPTNGGVRITVGTEDENAQLLQASGRFVTA